ncbi:MAG: glycosyltransferase [Erysipelotrichaceae bacterium]|nr:glycosyltransferase [Erysipelotrichaceae bacterium]
MTKTAILCISDPYLKRGELLRDYYKKRGDEVMILTPDYSHRHKCKIENPGQDVVLVHHMPYEKNLSWQRIWGHYDFSRRCYEKLREFMPDRIHSLVPANSLAYFTARYKKEHPETELILDINDLWPESLPLGPLKNLPGMGLWRNLRNNALESADHIFAECDLFKDVLETQTQNPVEPLYWARQEPASLSEPVWEKETAHFAYLGSINNIIDLDLMELFFRKMNQAMPSVLHIIGDGEKKAEMTERISKTGTRVIDHGVIFDAASKQDIFNHCRFGVNMMKESVLAGLPMKSLDYLAAGLPLLSSARGDLEEICQKEHAGIFLDRNSLDQAVRKIAGQSFEDSLQMRRHAHQVFKDKFTLESFEHTLTEALDSSQK